MAVIISAAAGLDVANDASVSGTVTNNGRGPVAFYWTSDQSHDAAITYDQDGSGTFYAPILGSGELDPTLSALAAGNHSIVVPSYNVPFVRLTLTNKSGGAAADFTADAIKDNRRRRII